MATYFLIASHVVLLSNWMTESQKYRFWLSKLFKFFSVTFNYFFAAFLLAQTKRLKCFTWFYFSSYWYILFAFIFCFFLIFLSQVFLFVACFLLLFSSFWVIPHQILSLIHILPLVLLDGVHRLTRYSYISEELLHNVCFADTLLTPLVKIKQSEVN